MYSTLPLVAILGIDLAIVAIFLAALSVPDLNQTRTWLMAQPAPGTWDRLAEMRRIAHAAVEV